MSMMLSFMQYLTPKDVAEMLNVDITTIYAWVCAGKIPHIKLGRLLRFDEVRIKEWMETMGKND